MTLKKITLTLAAAACILGGCKREMTVGEAVDFLYEYMSIADKGDYSEDFFRDNAEVALRARREMPWGKAAGRPDVQALRAARQGEQRAA